MSRKERHCLVPLRSEKLWSSAVTGARSRRDVVHPEAPQPQAFRLEQHVHVKSNGGFSPAHAEGHVACPSADAAEEVADVHYEQVWSFQGCEMAAAVEV